MNVGILWTTGNNASLELRPGCNMWVSLACEITRLMVIDEVIEIMCGGGSCH